MSAASFPLLAYFPGSKSDTGGYRAYNRRLRLRASVSGIVSRTTPCAQPMPACENRSGAFVGRSRCDELLLGAGWDEIAATSPARTERARCFLPLLY